MSFQNNGPAYGNAYDNSEPGVQRMPSPSPFRPQENPWASQRMESNKTETNEGDGFSSPNAYQFTGTRYADQGHLNNAYTPTPDPHLHANAPSTPAPSSTPLPTQTQSPAPVYGRPSKLRLLLRFLQFITSVGHLGFAAGASPYSGQDVPFDNKACFYYLFAVAVLTIIWSGYHICHYGYRRMAHGQKAKWFIVFAIDLLLAFMWGVGIIVEIATFPCPPGGHNHFCDFYNVSIFWGFLAFVLFILAVVWDIFGACRNRNR